MLKVAGAALSAEYDDFFGEGTGLLETFLKAAGTIQEKLS